MEQIITGMKEWELGRVCVFYLNSFLLPISDYVCTPPGKQTSKVVLDRERERERERWKGVSGEMNFVLTTQNMAVSNFVVSPHCTQTLDHLLRRTGDIIISNTKNFRGGSHGPRMLFVVLF
jgi:hypothetical protein